MSSKVPKVQNNIQIAELGTLSQAIGVRYDENLSKIGEDRILDSLMANEKKESNALISSMNRTKSASSLVEKDSARDEALSALIDMAKAYTLLGTASQKQTAVKVCALLDKYKGIAHLNNATESAKIASLLEDLDKEGNKEAVEALPNLAEAVAAVRAAEADFLASVKAQEDEKLGLGDNASAVKKRLIALLNDKLIPYLNIASELFAENYGAFAEQVALAVNKSNSVVTQRAKRS